MTDDSRSVFLDTNIIVRANVVTAPFHQECLSALQKLEEIGAALWLSRQVLREYIATVSREQSFMKPLSAALISERVRYFEAHFNIADDTAQVTSKLLALLVEIPSGGKQTHDANIVATMQANGIADLLTLNTVDFARFAARIKLLSFEDIAAI